MLLNPLAAPKGVKLQCELCQKPAHVQCTNCRYTYYCGEAHQREDWEAIHERICPLVTVLRAPLPHASSEEERKHHKYQEGLRKKHIIKVAIQEGRRFLYEGRPSLAIPAALEALKFLTEVYGGADIQLTPAYLILAEAAIGLGKLREAEQYLSQAQWSVLQTPDCEPWLKSRLHRNLGQLEAARNNLAQARKHFAEDIYQSSVAYSPHAVQTSGGYYHLGGVFLREGKHDITLSLHDQVVAIWQGHLGGLVRSLQESHRAQPREPSAMQLPRSDATPPSPMTLETAERAEASHVLHSIRELREQAGQPSAELLVGPYHTLALLHCLLRETAKSEGYARKVLQLCQDSPDYSDIAASAEALLQLLATLDPGTQS